MSQNRFFSRVQALQEARDSLLCIGLDPDPARLPAHLPKGAKGMLAFCQAIIDATHDLVCCYKPQIAHFAGAGAEEALEAVIRHAQGKDIPVLLDAKRGDVESTAVHYAKELFGRYGADAATVNPYLGLEALDPYWSYPDHGLFILCRTSNSGSADIQRLQLKDGRYLYEQIAEMAAGLRKATGNVGLVVGANRPEELQRLRQRCPGICFLLPGLGAQGADVRAMLEAGQGGGMIASSSRAILYAGKGKDFAERARQAAQRAIDEIRRAQPQASGID